MIKRKKTQMFRRSKKKGGIVGKPDFGLSTLPPFAVGNPDFGLSTQGVDNPDFGLSMPRVIINFSVL